MYLTIRDLAEVVGDGAVAETLRRCKTDAPAPAELRSNVSDTNQPTISTLSEAGN